MAFGSEKNATRRSKNFYDMYSHFDTDPVCFRRMDGIAIAILQSAYSFACERVIKTCSKVVNCPYLKWAWSVQVWRHPQNQMHANYRRSEGAVAQSPIVRRCSKVFFTALKTCVRSAVLSCVVCPSVVRLSVTMVDCGHIHWDSQEK